MLLVPACAAAAAGDDADEDAAAAVAAARGWQGHGWRHGSKQPDRHVACNAAAHHPPCSPLLLPSPSTSAPQVAPFSGGWRAQRGGAPPRVRGPLSGHADGSGRPHAHAPRHPRHARALQQPLHADAPWHDARAGRAHKDACVRPGVGGHAGAPWLWVRYRRGGGSKYRQQE